MAGKNALGNTDAPLGLSRLPRGDYPRRSGAQNSYRLGATWELEHSHPALLLALLHSPAWPVMLHYTIRRH